MTDSTSIRRLGRVTGLLYLVIVVFGMLSPTVFETVVVPGDAAATADNVLGSLPLFGVSLVGWLVIVVVDVALSATFYLLLEPVGRALSLTVAALRLAYSAVLGALVPHVFEGYRLIVDARAEGALGVVGARSAALSHLEFFSTGFLVALVFFGAHLAGLGLLLHRSRYVPRIFGILLMAAGAGYILDSLFTVFIEGYGGFATAILLTPAVAGELGLTVWLLLKGVRVGEQIA
jgi:Domain of unknown function (DUF4386)